MGKLLTLSFVIILFCNGCLPENMRKSTKDIEEFKQLSKILVEIKASSSAGVTPDEWGELIKKYSIASDNYKIAVNPNEYERLFLKQISNFMRSAADSWRINLPSNCNYTKTPNDGCIRAYSEQLFIKGLSYGTEENIYIRTKEYLVEKNISINEDKSEYVSLYLSKTSKEIDDFFALHSIKL